MTHSQPAASRRRLPGREAGREGAPQGRTNLGEYRPTLRRPVRPRRSIPMLGRERVPFLAWGLIFWAVPAAAVWDGTPPNWFAPVVLLPYPLLYLAIVDVMPQVVNGSFKHECKLQVTTMDGHKICP